MDLEIKRQIIGDYKEAFNSINKIGSRKRINGLVLKPHQYLSPSTLFIERNLKDDSGEFFHYNDICETLERLLAGEEVEYNGRFRDALENIKNLMKNPYSE